MIDDPAARVALAVVAPICPLIPALVLLVISVLQPWWAVSRDITYYPTNTSSFTVTQRSEISLWGHHGCKLNETWSDICGLPASECIYPPAPPEGYIPPWTPAPFEENQEEWRLEAVTGPPGVRVTTTRDDRNFRCVSGSCDTPVITTTRDAASINQANAEVPQGSVAFGDGQARLGEEVVSSGEDAFRIPPTTPPPSPPTPRPTFEPEVGEVSDSIFATAPPTTSWEPRGPFAGLWGNTGRGSGGIAVEQLYEKMDPALAADNSIPQAPIPGAQLAVEKCPPYAERFWDPLSPPAGQFICHLKDTCGKVSPVLTALMITAGLLAVNIFALTAVGCASQGAFDVTASFCSVGILPVALISHITALGLAGNVGLSPPEFEMSSLGAICAIMSLLLVILALIMAVCGMASHFAVVNMLEKAAASAQVAAEHAQANIEATEEWRLEKDREDAAKKPAPLGWRSKKVVPEETLGLEDQRRASTPPSEVATSAGSSTGSPRGLLQASVLAIGDAPAQPEATTTLVVPEQRLSVAVRSAAEAAPSPATENCMRSFINSPEGAVYAQRCAQPASSVASSALQSAREVPEWVPKVSRSSGMTYYVNSETGETKWTPPGSPHDAWARDQDWQDRASEVSHAASPAVAEMWKKKRLKNGTVISVRAQ